MSGLEKGSKFLTSVPGGGYKILLLDVSEMDDDADPVVDTAPVLAFLIYESPTIVDGVFYHEIVPVTADMVHTPGTQEYALMRPDGTIDVPHDRSFATLDEFKVCLKQERLKEKTKSK